MWVGVGLELPNYLSGVSWPRGVSPRPCALAHYYLFGCFQARFGREALLRGLLWTGDTALGPYVLHPALPTYEKKITTPFQAPFGPRPCTLA